MIGIDPSVGSGVLATYRGDLPEVIVTGMSMEDMVPIARTNMDSSLKESMAVVAVPAWYHDGQRGEIVEQARSLGLEKLRLINRPTAAALAYSIFKPAERNVLMVIELLDNNFDVSVIERAEGGFEVIATNGIQDMDKDVTWKTERLYEAIKAPIQQALKESKIASGGLDEILFSGGTNLLKGLENQMLADFGHSGSSLVEPAHVVALGAAVYARLIEMGL